MIMDDLRITHFGRDMMISVLPYQLILVPEAKPTTDVSLQTWRGDVPVILIKNNSRTPRFICPKSRLQWKVPL